MSIRIDGTNTAANPGITGSDADTGLQFGTDEVSIVTGGTDRVKVDSSGRLLVGTSSTSNGQDGTIINRCSGTSSPSSLFKSGGWSMYSISGEPALVLSSNVDTSGVGTASETARGGIGFEYINSSTPTRFVIGTVTASSVPSPVTFWTEGTERMRISSDGTFYLKTAGSTPSSSVSGAAWGFGGGTNNYWINAVNSTGTANHWSFVNGNGAVGSITTNASTTAYNTSSDYRLKENIEPAIDGITRLQQLKPCRFNFIASPSHIIDGFIAHEVQDVVPEAINGTKDEVDADGNPVYQGIDQSKLVPLLTAALQEAIAKIETLETQNASQAATIAAIEARLTALEGGAE